ncbi:NACHT, LRR and PYD domains-containing protein 5-like isoform X1 [Chanodichthys erythropterus]|uniref:NACHT, LRR and PYD domains-containing protein 5-like isoform X1 n=1 Tax=Chanodichthys erythropterus TaxID=933992 RepID=UPI00351EF377
MQQNVASKMMQETPRSSSPEPSCVSLKSDKPLHHPPDLSDEAVTSDPSRGSQRASSPEPSCVFLKSDKSLHHSPDEPVTSDPITVYGDDQTGDHDSPQRPTQRVKDRHKTSMKNKYERLFEGLKLQENETLLNRIYTQLYIIEGESEGVNEEHEVLQMEKKARTQHSQETPIYCNDIFKASPEPGCEEKDQIKTVLTKGIAGIGKTVSVQKFILDWAEGKANQDVDFMFVLPFRELNLIQDHQYSLHRLLLDFHPELQDLDSKIYEECKVVFIFDGLDESRITEFSDEFSDAQKVSDVTETSSVGVLMSNLMKGELLPSALIWITSRPAAANQIPSKYINRLTEIQGFNESQKEEYFRKRISDEHQASRIISHIRRARSLHIMCHIPVFCWISSTVLQKLLKEDLSTEIPQTLTEMYIHFLLIQINMRNQKYEERDSEKLLQSNREVIVKLAEVAFKQLMKGNVMFYEEDLKESGIDVTDASVYSGICTEIFKEESLILQRKIYSFIHLSVQEFLAAFYVFYSHVVKKKMPLHEFRYYILNQASLDDLLRSAVDEALWRKNGHLDLFLRFLLGISLESNQRLLRDLLTHTENSSESIRKTTQYIKGKIKDKLNRYHLSADTSMNLFLCLLEMKDQTLSRDIQEFVKLDKYSEEKLSPAQCSTISYMIQMSEEVLDELDATKYNTSDEGRRRLIPALINCRKALLTGCNITGQDCEIMTSALQSSNCVLRELDLSNNYLQDSGVKLLSDVLKSPNCQLQLLRLSGCMMTEEGCGYVSSALSSNPSRLREIDLSNNDLQDSGVKIISDGLTSPNCQLHTLRLSGCMMTEKGCGFVSSVLISNPSYLTELDLSNNDLQDLGVKVISNGLISPNCQLHILRLSGCMMTEGGCGYMSSALSSNPSHLRELDLSSNDLQDSGVKIISEGLKSPNCQLQKLKLSGCMVTEEGCGFVSSALSSNPSHLRELDLSYNHPGDSGVKLLSDKLKDCSLQILNVDHCGEFRIRAGPQKWACDLTLDPNTAHTELILSDENRKITNMRTKQPYPDHPERFDEYFQVLCGESLPGRCYWEVEWSRGAVISVTYKGISRKGLMEDCMFGYNDKSWSLECFNTNFYVRHNTNGTYIPVDRSSSTRVGVYVDVSARTLSFYTISDTHTLTHLHTFNTTFTEPLYAGFRVDYYKSSVSLCDIKQPPVRNNSDTHTTSVDHCGEFRITAELHKYAGDLTLDPNTANTRLILSEENRKVTRVFQDQSYPDHPERFVDVPQVLCGESLIGRCYWEAEWSRGAEISVTYKGISRKGESEDSVFGYNDKSWSLECSNKSFSARHNKNSTKIPVISSSSKRVGVYVDVSAGTLSFYSVSDTHTLTHLHTFNTTFTEPLYAGFGVHYYKSSVSLCDIKQPPLRNNSDTHTTRFSDSKPSGLNIHPLLNCQSCVHIADSDQWVQIEPLACTDEGGSKFRVSTDPGHYECVRTRMRWVCDYEVTLQYCTVDGHFLNKELERLQCNRIGPVIDVTVISGKLEEVHLPHYACLGESDPSLKDAVKVLSVKDEGITTEPVQLTRFHAKIVQPSFSLKTLIISWIMQVDEHCDLLLYMHSKVPLILHVYFFPFDDCAKEKVEKEEKSSCPIPHPRPDRPFRMKTPHILDISGALTIHPKEGITLRRETPPNYFKVTTRLENDLQMTLIREEDKEEVWTATILKDELDLINPKRDEPNLNSEAVQMSNNTPTGDSVGVTADTGASVNAPVLTRNTITGPVHINYILNPAVHNEATKINEDSATEN